MELKLDKTTKILLGAIALGLFLNASNVFIDKAYAKDKIQKVALCNLNDTGLISNMNCAQIVYGELSVNK
jgi:hypothetical protein